MIKFVDLEKQRKLIEDKINSRIQAVFAHSKYIMGPEIAELEQKLADYVGVKHCIGVASGTDALLIAMLALGIGPGDEVITTPFTFIATGEIIVLLGARPVFVDIEPDTYNIDPSKLEVAITEKTKAIIPVSLYGQCADLTRINEIAAKHDIPVIEDGAQSMGATHHGQISCGLTTLGCTSFFPAKPLGCYGDGGACFTDDDDLAKLIRTLRVHGQDRRYHHPIIGLNGRLDTLQAAVLLEKFVLFPDEVKKRAQVAARYTELLHDKVKTPLVRPENTSVFAQYTIEVENRDELRAKLQEAGVPTAIHYPVPLHLQPAFANLGLGKDSFPVAEEASKRVLSLPMHAYLEEDEITEVVKNINEYYPELLCVG
jgi:UDP-2-acetamido-2-deoxy-ribo-hexuluronate aminotransferase